MDYAKIRTLLSSEPAFREKQVRRAIFSELHEHWDDITTLPKGVREQLQGSCPLTIEAELFESQKGDSAKALITLRDGKRIETVLMRHGDRNTVCVSTLVGCPMGCTFCATGKMGMDRKLTADEIVEQVLFFARYLKSINARFADVVTPRDRSKGACPVLVSRDNASASLRAASTPKSSTQPDERVGSVVFMGMGEPFLNYDAVMDAIRMLNDKRAFNIGARHISISTCGIPEGIRRLADEKLQINLAISLHAPNDDVRRLLMPVARAYPLAELMAAVDEYIAKTNRKVMFEYLLAKDVNDKDAHAYELARLLHGKLCMVNLISYNPTGVYTSSSEAHMNHFRKLLQEKGVEATIRYRFGRDIEGACGQLATEKSSPITT